VIGTAEPVTILRVNADGSRMVRRDGTRMNPAGRDASGNRMLPLSDLAATEAEAFDAKRLPLNVLSGIDQLYETDRSDLIWESEHFAQLAPEASVEVLEGIELAASTGLRRRDLVRLSWSAIGPHAIVWKTGKSKGKIVITVPMVPETRAARSDYCTARTCNGPRSVRTAASRYRTPSCRTAAGCLGNREASVAASKTRNRRAASTATCTICAGPSQPSVWSPD